MSRNDAPRRDIVLIAAACLACGGGLTALWIWLPIGFGLHSTVGKEALYLFTLLQAVHLAVLRRRLRRDSAAFGKRRRTALRVLLALWCLGAAALLLSLVFALLGEAYTNAWVSTPCTIGTYTTAIAWLALTVLTVDVLRKRS